MRANPENLKKLKQGVEKWNVWRKKQPDIKPNLSGADLSRITNVKVKFIDFSHTNLNKTNLDYSYLKGTKLRFAQMYGTLFD